MRLTGFASILIAVGFVLATVQPAGAVSSQTVACDVASIRSNNCPPGTTGAIGDGSAAVGATEVQPGAAGVPAAPGSRGTGGRAQPKPVWQWTDAERRAYEDERRRQAEAAGGFYRDEFWPGRTPTPGTEEAAPVTLSDIATFRPDTGSIVTEPDGWTVLGLPANIYSTAGTHTVSGTLLGYAASVRFTPTAWHWDYGDGTSATTTVGGAPWGTSGAGEFDATATSHTYASTGQHAISLTIDFSAAYTITGAGAGPGAWTVIAGSLPVATTPRTATTTNADTVLVASDCTANPAGPGC
jgi:hypothetical protein